MKINVTSQKGNKTGIPSELTDLEKVKRAISLVLKDQNIKTLKTSMVVPAFPSTTFSILNKVPIGGGAATVYGNVRYLHSSYSVTFNINTYTHSDFTKDKYRATADGALSGTIRFEDTTDSHGFQDVKLIEYKLN